MTYFVIIFYSLMIYVSICQETVYKYLFLLCMELYFFSQLKICNSPKHVRRASMAEWIACQAAVAASGAVSSRALLNDSL